MRASTIVLLLGLCTGCGAKTDLRIADAAPAADILDAPRDVPPLCNTAPPYSIELSCFDDAFWNLDPTRCWNQDGCLTCTLPYDTPMKPWCVQPLDEELGRPDFVCTRTTDSAGVPVFRRFDGPYERLDDIVAINGTDDSVFGYRSALEPLTIRAVYPGGHFSELTYPACPDCELPDSPTSDFDIREVSLHGFETDGETVRRYGQSYPAPGAHDLADTCPHCAIWIEGDDTLVHTNGLREIDPPPIRTAIAGSGAAHLWVSADEDVGHGSWSDLAVVRGTRAAFDGPRWGSFEAELASPPRRGRSLGVGVRVPKRRHHPRP